MSSSCDFFLSDSNIFVAAQYAEAVTQMLRTAEYETVFDDDGNITSFYYNGSGMGDDEELYQALAPYMRSGCFLEVCNEMGNAWRWVYCDGVCTRVCPVVLWPKPDAPRELSRQIQTAFSQHLMDE